MGEPSAENKVPPNLFRKSALDKLASPEQLDLLLRVTNPRGWLALLPLCALLAVAIVWSFLGSIPTSLNGNGILLHQGNPMEVVAAHNGTLMEMNVQVGDEVHAGQVIARVAQPELLDQVRHAKEELAELEAQKLVLDRRDEQARDLEMSALTQLRKSLLDNIGVGEKRRIDIQEIVKKYHVLLADRVTTEPQVLAAEQSLDAVIKEISDSQVRLKEVAAREDQLDQNLRKEALLRQTHISDVKRNIASLEERLERTSTVVSPFTGRVAELRISRRHTEIHIGTPLLLLVPSGGEEELLAMVYVSASEGKRIKEGMTVEISPTTVRREEHGYLVGTVVSVSELPTTEQAMMARLNDAGLVQSFLKTSGIPLEVQVRLRRDPQTPSGYQWSSSQGPVMQLSPGTLCTASIVVKEQRPISLALPLFKDKLGMN